MDKNTSTQKTKYLATLLTKNTKTRCDDVRATRKTLLRWRPFLCRCYLGNKYLPSVCVCVSVHWAEGLVDCPVGSGVKAVGGGPGSSGGRKGVRGKRRRAVREGSQGGWRHFFLVGLPVVGVVLEVTVWNLWKNSEMDWDRHPRR